MHLTERACAKINLTLRIRGRRPDGFHELSSLVVFAADAADTLLLDTTRAAGVTVTGPFASDLGGDRNLVTAAVETVATTWPAALVGHVTLDKALPVAAGIGGGSADAAATLRLLRRANPAYAGDRAAWHAIATALGSDVPVCLESRLSHMSGRGERLSPLTPQALLAAVLVNPRVAVPAGKTGAVFKALAAAMVTHQPDQPPPVAGHQLTLAALAGSPNDLEAPATRVMPVIADVLAALRSTPDVRLARLSGAGPTCFGLYDRLAQAETAAAHLAIRHPTWWIAPTRLT